jgi:hypothetical protein
MSSRNTIKQNAVWRFFRQTAISNRQVTTSTVSKALARWYTYHLKQKQNGQAVEDSHFPGLPLGAVPYLLGQPLFVPDY